VSCKNRIFRKNPVFLYTSTHKIKVDKALTSVTKISDFTVMYLWGISEIFFDSIKLIDYKAKSGFTVFFRAVFSCVQEYKNVII